VYSFGALCPTWSCGFLVQTTKARMTDTARLCYLSLTVLIPECIAHELVIQLISGHPFNLRSAIILRIKLTMQQAIKQPPQTACKVSTSYIYQTYLTSSGLAGYNDDSPPSSPPRNPISPRRKGQSVSPSSRQIPVRTRNHTLPLSRFIHTHIS
jgi:hypothetical protein